MDYQYFGTFIAGTEEIVKGILHERLRGDLTIHSLSSGAVAFRAPVPYSGLNLFCFHNLFRVLYTAQTAPTPAGLENFLRSLPAAPVDWPAARENRGKAKSFRLVVSCKNQLVSVSRKVKSETEKKLSAETGLRPDRSLPDSEFWAIVRDDGRAYLLKRLSRHRAYDKLLHPGELHPELAYMLCWLTAPKHTDLVVDPFCGYGAIPLQRCQRFPYKEIFAYDLDAKSLAITEQKLKGKARVQVGRRDALTLPTALPERVDAIITDPPWGLYGDVGMELEEFYRRMLAAFVQALRPGGRAVVLTAGKREFAAALGSAGAWSLSGRYDILVSGKKAAIFVMEAGKEQRTQP